MGQAREWHGRLEWMPMHTYTVKKGESVKSVSAKFALPEAALCRDNPTPFFEGQRLTVPVDILFLPPEAAKNAAEYYQVPESSILRRPDGVNVLFTLSTQK